MVRVKGKNVTTVAMVMGRCVVRVTRRDVVGVIRMMGHVTGVARGRRRDVIDVVRVMGEM